MELFRVVGLSSIAVAIRVSILFVINKLFAIYIGVAGYAAYGNIQNFIQVCIALSGGAYATGLTKYTRDANDDPKKLGGLWVLAFLLSAGLSLLIGTATFIFREAIAVALLAQSGLSFVIASLAVALPFTCANVLALAIANGRGNIKTYVVCHSIGSLIALLLILVVIRRFELAGALVALCVYQSVALLSTVIFSRKILRENVIWHWPHRPAEVLLKLLSYMGVGLVTAITVPLSQFLSRSIILQSLGIDAAGLWEALLRVSGMVLMLVTTTLSVYLVPKYTACRSYDDINAEVKATSIRLLPLLVVGLLILYWFRSPAVTFAFSEEFLPITQLFPWQFIGDFFKISSWLVAYAFLSKAMLREYVLLEIVFSLANVAVLWSLINRVGLDGAPIAHAITYGSYLAASVFLLRYRLKSHMARTLV